MSIKVWFTQDFAVKRGQWKEEDGQTYLDPASETTFQGHIQQLDAESAEGLVQDFSKGYKIWCDIDTAVQESDTIEYGGKTYTVVGLRKALHGRNKHLEVILELNS